MPLKQKVWINTASLGMADQKNSIDNQSEGDQQNALTSTIKKKRRTYAMTEVARNHYSATDIYFGFKSVARNSELITHLPLHSLLQFK